MGRRHLDATGDKEGFHAQSGRSPWMSHVQSICAEGDELPYQGPREPHGRVISEPPTAPASKAGYLCAGTAAVTGRLAGMTRWPVTGVAVASVSGNGITCSTSPIRDRTRPLERVPTSPEPSRVADWPARRWLVNRMAGPLSAATLVTIWKPSGEST